MKRKNKKYDKIEIKILYNINRIKMTIINNDNFYYQNTINSLSFTLGSVIQVQSGEKLGKKKVSIGIWSDENIHKDLSKYSISIQYFNTNEYYCTKYSTVQYSKLYY